MKSHADETAKEGEDGKGLKIQNNGKTEEMTKMTKEWSEYKEENQKRELSQTKEKSS